MAAPRQEDLFDNTASKLRFQAYSKLQAAAVAFGEALPIPEIVAIGGQSDGKSSLLEAFLGVRTGWGWGRRSAGAADLYPCAHPVAPPHRSFASTSAR